MVEIMIMERFDLKSTILAYIDAQTYDTSLTRGKLWEELGAHAPYFYLERMTMLVVSTCGMSHSECVLDDTLSHYFRRLEYSMQSIME